MEKGKLGFSTQTQKGIFLLGSAAMAIFCSKAFVINPHLYIGKSAIPADTTDYLWGFFALFLWALFCYAFGVLRLRPRVGEVVFGLLFGVANFFGTSLFAYDSWAFIGVSLSWFAVVFKCLGQGFTMMAGLTLVAHLLQRAAEKRKPALDAAGPTGPFARVLRLYRNHTVLFCSVVFFLCWVPYMAAFYPGSVIYDMCVIVRQYFGLQPMTTWHCVFTNYFFGSCIWLGRQLGSDNYGTLIYMLGQSALMAYAFGCLMRYLRAINAGKAWQWAALAFYGLVPIWGCYAMMIGKDTYYTATLMLFFLHTLSLLHNGREALPKTRTLIGYSVTALLVCLWRNNGLYVVLPSTVGILLFLARGRRQKIRVGIPLVSAVVLALLFHNALVPALGIIDDSGSGIYSVAFQQTARIVRDHKGELTPEEVAEIDRILDYEQIGSMYEPWISDPVKDTFRQFGQGAEVEKEALDRFRPVWLSLVQKYPETSLQAFLAGNVSYYAFTPKYDGITYNQQAGQRFVFTNYWEPNEGELHTTQPEALTPLRNFMISFANRWWTLPGLAYLYVFPFYTWLLVAVGLSLVHQGRWRALMVMLPALLSFGVCLLSPADDYLRYFLPIIAMTLPTLAAAVHRGPGEEPPKG